VAVAEEEVVAEVVAAAVAKTNWNCKHVITPTTIPCYSFQPEPIRLFYLQTFAKILH